MVKKEDWKTVNMPEENEKFMITLSLTEENKDWLKKGFLPKQMEDKWFVYEDNNQLFFHRSWTGYCIYIVKEKENNTYEVTVNRNQKQYTETSVEKDKERIINLIKWLARM